MKMSEQEMKVALLIDGEGLVSEADGRLYYYLGQDRHYIDIKEHVVRGNPLRSSRRSQGLKYHTSNRYTGGEGRYVSALTILCCIKKWQSWHEKETATKNNYDSLIAAGLLELRDSLGGTDLNVSVATEESKTSNPLLKVESPRGTVTYEISWKEDGKTVKYEAVAETYNEVIRNKIHLLILG